MSAYRLGLSIFASRGTRDLLVLRHRSHDELLRLHHLLLPRAVLHADEYPRPPRHGVLARLELEEGVVVRVQQVLVPVERGGVLGQLDPYALAGIYVKVDVVWYLAAGGLD